MKPNHLFCGCAMLLSGASLMSRAIAQPATAPATATAPTIKPIPPLSLVELEKLIGGRTTLTLNLKDATLEDAAAAINASSGLKLKVRPRPVFKLPPGMENVQLQTSKEPVYNFEAKGGPFWEEFLAWQRAARAVQKAAPPQPDMVPRNGRMMRPRSNLNLGLFHPQQFNQDINLEAGNPFPEGRIIASWPYVMIGTRINRNQAAALDEEGLQTIEALRTRNPFLSFRMAATDALPATPKAPPTEEERWQDGLTLSAQVYLDPKMKPLNMRCEVEEAIDDKGNDLRAASDSVSMDGSIFNRFSSGINGGTTISIPLGSKPKMGKQLVKLRGLLHFTVVTKSQHWETTDFDTPKDGTISRDGTDFAVQFAGLTKTPNGWEANFSAHGEGKRLQDLWNQWMIENQGARQNGGLGGWGILGGTDFVVQFVDADGQISTSNSGGHEATLGGVRGTKPAISVRPGDSPLPLDITTQVYDEKVHRGAGSRFNANGDIITARPVKLMVDLPLERREVVVPFEFTNLPLPPS